MLEIVEDRAQRWARSLANISNSRLSWKRKTLFKSASNARCSSCRLQYIIERSFPMVKSVRRMSIGAVDDLPQKWPEVTSLLYFYS